MALWFTEEGIGENRAVRIEAGEIVAARVEWPGELAAGQVAEARLVSRRPGGVRGVAEFADGRRTLVDRLPRDVSEGAELRLLVTRPVLTEVSRAKLARTRPTGDLPRPAPALGEALRTEGHEVRPVRRFPAGDWNALMADAFASETVFTGGSLWLSPTPAMTLIDVDGEDAPSRLALAACEPTARALLRFDIGGSVGVDFPTIPDRADRRAVDQALAAALAGWPHERTAMNGFGFVQLVARLERVSILHRAALRPAAAAARLLLRRAEQIDGPGLTELVAHPALLSHLSPQWLAELDRRTGRGHRLRADPTLAIEAAQAQVIGR